MAKQHPPTPPHTVEPLLRSVVDTATILSVSESTIWAWIREGHLRSVALGRRRLIPTEAINEILQQGLAA